MFSVADTTLVPVLITLCFAARAVVVCGVAARALRAFCVVDTGAVGALVALRAVTARVPVFTFCPVFIAVGCVRATLALDARAVGC